MTLYGKHVSFYPRPHAAFVLLLAVVFSMAAVPFITAKLPEKAVDTVTYYIKGDIGYDAPEKTDETDNLSLGDETLPSECSLCVETTFAAPETTVTAAAEETAAAPVTGYTSPRQTVRAVNLSRNPQNGEQKMYLMNETGYEVDLKEYAAKEYDFAPVDVKSPVVLVIHTHGTEAYLADGVDVYDEKTKYRSTDSAYNVVGIGTEFCRVLEENGISTIHDVTLHDLENINEAYSSSRAAMKKNLKQYPDISYVIDIHRDTVFTSDGENQKPVVTVNGKPAAQVMLVVGTDEGGALHPDWRENLTLAAKLQEAFNCYPAFARPVYLRKASFNQQLCKGALILEVGSCGNTVSEAREAAVLAATQFAKLIKRDG